MIRKVLLCTAAATLATAVACSKSTPTPVSPSGAVPGDSAAAPDGSTLKVTTPSLVSPSGGTQTVDPLVLTASKATGKFGDVTPSYQFEVRSGSTVVYSSGTVGGVGSGNNVTHTVPSTATGVLPDTNYTWRVRAVSGTAVGSWSSDASFRSPVGAYIRGNELRDPLTIGRTVGTAVGPVQITSRGLELITHESRVTYELPQTLEAGEFSLMVTGIDEGSAGDKTKIMSMQEGYGDLTANDYRMTVEKRGRLYPEPGAIQFRIITGDADDHGRIFDSPFRTPLAMSDERWYFWRFAWRTGFAELDVRVDSPTGAVVFRREVGTGSRPYRPVPHVIHLGASVGRAGVQDASIPGAVYKNVYVGPGPRPAFPN